MVQVESRTRLLSNLNSSVPQRTIPSCRLQFEILHYGTKMDNQPIRATGGREHTELRVLDAGRSSSSCLSHFGFFITRLIVGGRSKRSIPLPIFKNEPMGRNSEYTYYYSIWKTSEDCELLIEMLSRQLGGTLERTFEPAGQAASA